MIGVIGDSPGIIGTLGDSSQHITGALGECKYFIYGKLNQDIKTYKYIGLTTDTIVVTVNNKDLTISADVIAATVAQINLYL